jgi:hypothetical protein
MKALVISAVIGIAAGIIDIIPNREIQCLKRYL